MLELALEADEEWDSSDAMAELIERAAIAALEQSAYPQLARSPRYVEISVRLAGDEEVRALNARWRGKDRATNVLSFPMLAEEELLRAAAPGPQLLLGDIILARGVCAMEAAEKGARLEDHVSHLVVHGTLHLLGHDHLDDAEASDMETREIRALRELGIANPYEEAA